MVILILVLSNHPVLAASPNSVNINVPNISNFGDNLNIAVIITLLTLSPAILLTMTCFPRYIITFSFLRQALGIQQLPPNQMIVGLAFFMTLFTMSPTFDNIYRDAYTPYINKQIDTQTAYTRALGEDKKFMLKQVREKDLVLFAKHAGLKELPNSRMDLPVKVVIPAFIISEFTTSFIMGFILYISFLLIDILTGFVLMAMGMMMLPPTMISIPLKILVFLIADGWYVVVEAMFKSFN